MAPGFDPTKPQIGAIQCSGEKVSSSSTPSAPRRPAFDATEAKARRLKREAEQRKEKAEKKKQRERLVSEFRDDRIYRGVNGARATGITDAKWAESFGASDAADREKRVVVFNGPGGRHDGDNGNDDRTATARRLAASVEAMSGFSGEKEKGDPTSTRPNAHNISPASRSPSTPSSRASAALFSATKQIRSNLETLSVSPAVTARSPRARKREWVA